MLREAENRPAFPRLPSPVSSGHTVCPDGYNVPHAVRRYNPYPPSPGAQCLIGAADSLSILNFQFSNLNSSGGDFMRRIWNGIREFTRRGDLLLLLLCVITSVFGLVIIASTTRFSDSNRFLIVQGAALVLGVMLYAVVSMIDVAIFAEHRILLLAISTVLMLMLRRWGIEVNGNRAWLSLPLLPVNIQPAEICKITFVLILAKTLSIHRDHISSLRSVGSATLETIYMVALIIVMSRDAGSAMVFLFIFLVGSLP